MIVRYTKKIPSLLQHPRRFFLLSIALQICFAPLWANSPIQILSPAIVISIQTQALSRALWKSFFAGCILDLLSSYHTLGIHTTSYLATTWLIFDYRHKVFYDVEWARPLLTFFFAAIASSFSYLLYHPYAFSLSWIGYHILFIPLLTACYTWTLFSLIPYCYNKLEVAILYRKNRSA